MTTETIKTTYPFDTKAEYHESTERLANELLAEYTPQQIAIIAAQHIIYVDFLKASADATEAASVAKDQLFQVQEQRLLLSIEECAKRLTVEVAAKYAYLATRAFVSYQAKGSVSARRDQILKPNWIAHCKAAIASGKEIETLNDLQQLQGYDPGAMTIQPATLRKWARSAGIKFKAGRKKTKVIAI